MAKAPHRSSLPLLGAVLRAVIGAVIGATGMLLGSLGVAASPLAMAQAELAGASTSPGIGEALAPSTPSQINLGEHLRQQGYLFYGAWWCPACFRQKSLFGQQAGNRLPYVECDRSDGGRQRCDAAAIKAYPTWVRGTERREGVLSLEELARWSGWNPARPPIGHGNGLPAGGVVPGGTTP